MGSEYKGLFNETGGEFDYLVVNGTISMSSLTIGNTTVVDGGTSNRTITIPDTAGVDGEFVLTNDTGQTIGGNNNWTGINSFSNAAGLLVDKISEYTLANGVNIASDLVLSEQVEFETNNYTDIGTSASKARKIYTGDIVANYMRDPADETYYNIHMDSANSRIRLNLGGGYIDLGWGSTAYLSAPNAYITSCGAGIAHFSSAGLLSSSAVVNADVSASAAIDYSKLALSNSITNSDINTAAAISYSKLNLSASVKSGDIDAQSSTNGYILTSNGAGGATWSPSPSISGYSLQDAYDNSGSQGRITTDNTRGGVTIKNGRGGGVGVDTFGVVNGANALVFIVDGAGTIYSDVLATGVCKSVSGTISSGLLVNADVSASAAIAYSKLNLTGSVLNADLAGSIDYSKLLLTGAIVNADLAGSIAYSKLVLTGEIVNADLAGSIAYSKLVLTGAVTNADLAGSIADSKLSNISTAGKVSNSATTATSANTASAIVTRDASGNFSAGTITAALSGNATTATSATSATDATNSTNVNLGNNTTTIYYIPMSVNGTGNNALKTDSSLRFLNTAGASILSCTNLAATTITGALDTSCTATTQSALDSSTKISTTKYTDDACAVVKTYVDSTNPYKLLTTQSITSRTTVTFSIYNYTGFGSFRIICKNLTYNSSATTLTMTFSTNSGSSYISTNYYSSNNILSSGGTNTLSTISNGSSILLHTAVNTYASNNQGTSFEMIVDGMNTSSTYPQVRAHMTFPFGSGTGINTGNLSGTCLNSTSVNEIKITAGSTINSGLFKLYGVL